MHDRDCLHRFMFERYPIRGHLVHLDTAWHALIEHREYPAPIRDTLGEAVAASLLLAATVKFEGVLSLQLQGDGPVHLVLAQCTGGLGVRGLARYREGVHRSESTGIDAGPERIADLIGAGNITVTLETDDGAQRYQGIVPITGGRLAESLQVYFENSEQLPTRLWLHADALGVSGMLLQKLPVADAAPVYFRCRCSRERVSRMLQSLGDAETRSVLAERGEVEVRCDFCNRAYVFDAVDVAQLFNTGVTSDSGSSVH